MCISLLWSMVALVADGWETICSALDTGRGASPSLGPTGMFATRPPDLSGHVQPNDGSEESEMTINPEERTLVRELAKRVAEIESIKERLEVRGGTLAEWRTFISDLIEEHGIHVGMHINSGWSDAKLEIDKPV